MSDVRVHHRGDRGVDGILRLIELAGHDGPIETMLTAMCGEIAAIAGADIASIYVREGERLVMRGNHGFDASAIGTVALDVGEGITGLVAEVMRPVSAATASDEASYKHVPGLGEEHFPVFAGIPAISGGTVIGVLVLQRRAQPFDHAEITLATALGAPVTLAIERRRAQAVRSARLDGTGHAGGAALGRTAVIPTTTALGAIPADLDRAFARLRDDVGRAVRRLADIDAPAAHAALDRLTLALHDARLRERLAAAAAEPTGLRTVARDYARAPYRLGTAPEEKGDEIEELCVLLGDPKALKAGAVWIGDSVGAVIAIAAVARGAAALVAAASLSPSAIAVARAASLPAVSGTPGLFAWARPGDLLAVDGDSGTVVVQPSPTDIERIKAAR
ncbi:MAG TPA: GAF domain-containing protein [Kofleriaceae bacterium]|jgi:phosphotransferase system enzyme I (PtsP)